MLPEQKLKGESGQRKKGASARGISDSDAHGLDDIQYLTEEPSHPYPSVSSSLGGPVLPKVETRTKFKRKNTKTTRLQEIN